MIKWEGEAGPGSRRQEDPLEDISALRLQALQSPRPTNEPGRPCKQGCPLGAASPNPALPLISWVHWSRPLQGLGFPGCKVVAKAPGILLAPVSTESTEAIYPLPGLTGNVQPRCTQCMWGLVNNAGISTFGEVEFTSMETYKEVAEVNLWGTVQMTKAFLPLIRRARGRIVNISSMLGRMANPARSPYCITKFGVEAFSDCLRYEMYPLGVKVSVVEPGNFIAATSLYNPERIQAIADKMWDELPEVVRKDYGRKYFDEKIARMQAYCNSGSTDISPVVSAVTHALTSRSPYTRYHPMDYYWWLRMQIMTHLPGALSDRIYIH
uniref:D-beta-hydroxybutyrate dehydrogenase, mitochondrial n=3 Tax=Canis lupus TaxID=9612 RepID=A0A8C0PBZ3_CANLF